LRTKTGVLQTDRVADKKAERRQAGARALTANKEQMRLLEEQTQTRLFCNALDPLLERLGAECIDDSDLSARIRKLFAVL
jgi:hypothetical protein